MGRGIPVPPVIPEGSKAFILCVPDDPFFYGVVMGALKVMTFRYYWQGSTEQIDAVTERMLTMYYDYQEQVGCMICDMVAECFADGNEALIEALAAAIRSNPLLQAAIADALASQGGATPGHSLTPGQSAANLLPDNVRDEFGDCVPDNLWGAMLYLVQSGNRLITDFFDVLEVASNTLESMEIISGAIPAAGDYISAAAGFADQMLENISEGYAGAYTEAYEQGLACDLFCLARTSCDLSLDAIISMLNGRLSEPFDIGDFGEIMTGIASRDWVGDELADVAFICFFGALKFGQQFGDTLGVRPLPVLMSLGADQLASNNWEVLCECSEVYCRLYDWTDTDYEFVPGNGFGASTEYVSGVGFRGIAQPGQFVDVMRDIVPDGAAPQSMRVFCAPANGSAPAVTIVLMLNGSFVYIEGFLLSPGQTELNITVPYTGLWDRMYIQLTNSAPDGTNVLTGVQFTGDGEAPDWLSDAVPC